MAFTKNMVMTDHAYRIEVKADADDDAPILSCPRCGHTQPRKLRTMCQGCKRFIPYDEARQRWDKKPKNPYLAELQDQVPEEVKEVNFKRMRNGYYMYVQMARTAVLALVLITGIYYATPYAGKAMLGEAKFNKLDKQIHQALAAQQPKKLASARHHK